WTKTILDGIIKPRTKLMDPTSRPRITREVTTSHIAIFHRRILLVGGEAINHCYCIYIFDHKWTKPRKHAQ
ncbi:unnamed protein product, partial [Allacma fusca]